MSSFIIYIWHIVPNWFLLLFSWSLFLVPSVLVLDSFKQAFFPNCLFQYYFLVLRFLKIFLANKFLLLFSPCFLIGTHSVPYKMMGCIIVSHVIVFVFFVIPQFHYDDTDDRESWDENVLLKFYICHPMSYLCKLIYLIPLFRVPFLSLCCRLPIALSVRTIQRFCVKSSIKRTALNDRLEFLQRSVILLHFVVTNASASGAVLH